MRHEYTIEYHKCPNCGKVLKIFNPMSYLALLIVTAFLPLLWFWGNSILQKIFKYDLEKMGSPYKQCPICGLTINMQYPKEWENLSLLQMKSWAFRRPIRTCIGLSGIIIFCLIVLIIPILVGEISADMLLFLLLPVLLLLIIYGIYKKWTKQLSLPEIVVSLSDYEIIKQSQKRLHKAEFERKEEYIIKIKETGEIIEA